MSSVIQVTGTAEFEAGLRIGNQPETKNRFPINISKGTIVLGSRVDNNPFEVV